MSAPSPETIETFIRIASRLIVIMQKEINFLRGMEVAKIAALQEEKTDLVGAYEDGIRRIAADPNTFSAMEPALKTELREIMSQFEEVVADNGRALETVRSSHERLLKAIVDAATEDRMRHAGYSNTGESPRFNGSNGSAHRALTFDQRL